MAIDEPVSDTSRAIQHDPDQTWPASVVLQVSWNTPEGYRVRTGVISADQFFGRGEFGAPMSGDAVISMIEHMRRAGPPPAPPKAGPVKNAKGKTLPASDGRGRKSGAMGNRPRAAVRAQRKGPS